jgi:hypothetical protein
MESSLSLSRLMKLGFPKHRLDSEFIDRGDEAAQVMTQHLRKRFILQSSGLVWTSGHERPGNLGTGESTKIAGHNTRMLAS